jgi:superfamily II DNA/RNA helicase
MMMDHNLLLDQYSRYKKQHLEESPFHCLLNANIELNPHQINAFCAAIQSLKTGGIILADEVGLGKTIEAGLVLNYVLDSGAKKVLVALPATLRKQWEVELQEKFGISAIILDRLAVERDVYAIQNRLEDRNQVSVVLTSYDYSSKLIKRFSKVKWDFLIIDEAHNLRNVFHGTKRAKNLYDLTTGWPKILLTATPIQNSLSDLHGLVSFIDPRIFGPEKIFNRRFVEVGDYEELKQELLPVLYRTLRRDVGTYMSFSKRTCITVDFHLSEAEKTLYDEVNAFLRRDSLYSIPTANRGLIILVIRKLLASSSFALIETFEVLENRLEKLYEGTKSANAQEGFNLFWDFVEDEIDETGFDEYDDEETALKKQAIQEELKIVRKILEIARGITSNAKIAALKKALTTAFAHLIEEGLDQKAVVFTESKRTQKYIAAELRKSGYGNEDILLFNGDFDDAMIKEIYRAWQVKNFGKSNYGRSVEYKHAIVDYFQSHAKVLIVTDAGSEGLNLQFCNTIINYDLPWNPQKIEQRIGRCHRYGQTHDVVAINLLNTDNEADRRVYEILSKKFELFEGVFGASDVALGALESGVSFEKRILDIYQNCKNITAVRKAFAELNRQLDSKKNAQAATLRSILLTESREAKRESLEKTKSDIEKYLKDVEYWSKFEGSEMDRQLYYWQIDNWGESVLGSHGTLFLGALMDNAKLLFPVLLLCDENGEYIDFSEEEIVSALEEADDSDVRFFKPTAEETANFERIYHRLIAEVCSKYSVTVAPILAYNEKKINNWVDIQLRQLHVQLSDAHKEVEGYLNEAITATDSLQNQDIKKKLAEAKNKMEKIQAELPQRKEKICAEAKAEIERFNQSQAINPILTINIVLKF